MRNDVQVKATWVTNSEGKDKVVFDYFNKEGDYIGDIIVTSEGKVSWSIIDANYKENILYAVDNILGSKNNKLHYETPDVDDKRWYNLRLYLYNHSILLNRSRKEEEKDTNFIR